jgi:hypothetical protein
VTLDDDRSAALLIRVWVEQSADGFRGRVSSIDTWGGSGGADEITLTVASSTSDVLDAVRRWLDGFVRSAANPIDTDEPPPGRLRPG